MRTKYYENSFNDVKIETNTSNPKKKLIDRVTKLFALADSTTHEEEAISARNIAVELLAKHNLSLNQKEVNDQEHITIQDHTELRAFAYDKILRHNLAKFTGVFVFLTKRRNGTIYNYIGTKTNLQAFQYMLYIVLEQRISAFTTWTASLDFQENPDKFAWKNGFSMGVGEKCTELTEQMKTKVEERGLVIVNEYTASSIKAHSQHNLQKGDRGVQRSTNSGIEAGKQVNLNKSISRQNKVLRISS